MMNFINLCKNDFDIDIYHIMPQKYAVQMFTNEQNVLRQVHRWKDKFENFQLNLGGVLDGQKFDYSFRDDLVGQCWTRHSLSEAMWGIYANDPNERYLRIRSTPRKLLTALIKAHPLMSQDTCFLGSVEYKSEKALKTYLKNEDRLDISAIGFAKSLLLKRRAFKHESEMRLIYLGEAKNYDTDGLYSYNIDPHQMITQIMADPNRDRKCWKADRECIKKATGFIGTIKRSKIYDPPDWDLQNYKSEL